MTGLRMLALLLILTEANVMTCIRPYHARVAKA